MLKVARTIADIENKTQVSADHLAEAFSYRLREEFERSLDFFPFSHCSIQYFQDLLSRLGQIKRVIRGSDALLSETAVTGDSVRAPKNTAAFSAPCAVDIKNSASFRDGTIFIAPVLLLKIETPESNPPITKKTATINGMLFFFHFFEIILIRV